MNRMRRWSGKLKPEPGVSRWLVQMIKEPEDAAPLIVRKVIRQYTRKKKVSVPDKTPAATEDVAAVCSEQSLVKIDIDNHNHLKIKEEYYPDNKIPHEDVEIHVKMEETSVPKNKNNNAMTDSKVQSPVKIKQENVTEIIKDNAQSCSRKVKKIKTEENTSIIISTDSNVSKREQQQSRKEITIKMEPADNSEDTDLDQKNIARHSEEGKAVRIIPKTDIECDSSEKMDEFKNIKIEIINEGNVTGQTFRGNHSQHKTLLTEEINIKEEIESDNDDRELAVTSNVKEEPADEAGTVGGQVEVPGITSVILEAYDGQKQDVIAMKNCYFVPETVALGMSGVCRSGPVSLLAANSQKLVQLENLAGLKVLSKTLIFTCNMCGKNVLSKIGLRQHMLKKHTVATPFECHCGRKFTHNFLLLAHMKVHSSRLNCDFCPKIFNTTQKLANHLNAHLKERFFSCPICVRRYTVFFNLQRHVASHRTTDIFECKSCSATYRCITDLRRHCERDHGEKVEYPCYVCSETLHSRAELIAHANSHGNALHECAFCTMRFTDVQKWEEHSATHIERLDAIRPVMRPFVCDVCMKRFEYRSTLKTHMSCHTDARPFKCKECPKTFKTPSAVSEHQKGHDRPYPCPECPARFAKRDARSRHVLLHSGEKPHACPHCARRFTQRSAMRQHVQRFHTPGLKRAKSGRDRKSK